MTKTFGMLFVGLASAGFLFAGRVASPEIDAASAVGAVTLLSGAVLILRSRRRS